MTQIEWKISNKEARVDSSRPAKGVQYKDASLLGVCVPEFTESAQDAILEQFKQEDRLTVRYAGTKTWPVWTEVTWGVYETRDRPGLNIDLNVSVRTNQPSCRPDLVAQSFLPKSDCFTIKDSQGQIKEPKGQIKDSQSQIKEPKGQTKDSQSQIKDFQGQPIQLTSGVPHTMTQADATGCVLFRPAEADWSLVEMVHPLDFEHDELSHDPEHPDHTRLSHRLFTQPLEKGVLLRARLRAIIIDRADDLETAALRYAEFTNEPPVL